MVIEKIVANIRFCIFRPIKPSNLTKFFAYHEEIK